ncbi:uncharacterized protein LOC111404779 [Olea europaea var. sylvestris]|uniref:uncharacterized protein LOC111404779 n=1 Tax=Olea europaea var. sylvestris TaxID=158386 RepID=UPI000C1D01DC|nr:uncharacterized protein LOC111404779 [Olea europaea var. sylvestris]
MVNDGSDGGFARIGNNEIVILVNDAEKVGYGRLNNFKSNRPIRYIFHVHRSASMILLYEYYIFWAFLIISSLIPILALFISEILASIRKGPEKLSNYESGIEPMGDAWLQFRIRYYMFSLVFVVFDVETVFLYPWAMSFDVLGVSVFIEALIFVLILIVGLVYAW